MARLFLLPKENKKSRSSYRQLRWHWILDTHIFWWEEIESSPTEQINVSKFREIIVEFLASSSRQNHSKLHRSERSVWKKAISNKYILVAIPHNMRHIISDPRGNPVYTSFGSWRGRNRENGFSSTSHAAHHNPSLPKSCATRTTNEGAKKAI